MLALRGRLSFNNLEFRIVVVEGLIKGVNMHIVLNEEHGPADESEHDELCIQLYLDRNRIQCFCLRVCSYWPIKKSLMESGPIP